MSEEDRVPSLRSGFQKTMDLNSLTIDSTRTAIASKQISASALVEQFYSKIKAEDPEIHAYLTLSKIARLRRQNILTTL